MAQASGIQLPADKSLLLVSFAVAGFGDLSCTMKFAHALEKRDVASEEQIVIAMLKSSREKIASFNFESKKFRFITIEELQSDYISLCKTYHFALQIIIPAPAKYSISHLTFLESGMRTLLFYEYGSPLEEPSRQNRHCFSLGLGEKELGIFSSPELFDGFREESERLTVQRANLQLLSDCLRTAVMGKEGFEEFQKKSRVYFGYANNQREGTNNAISEKFRLAFIRAILTLKKNQSKCSADSHIVFVIPGPDLSTSAIDKVKELARERNFGKISFQNLSTGDTCFSNPAPLHDRSLTIIVGRVQPRDFLRLFLVSEPECLVTGDQSLGEAISANKRFIYQALDHKQELSQTLNKKFFPHTISFVYSSTEKELEAMGAVFENLEIPYKAVNDSICQKHECSSRIHEIITQHLLSLVTD